MTRLPFLASTFRQRIDRSIKRILAEFALFRKIKGEGKKISASIFAWDVASTIRSLSGGISFSARYFYENSRTNVQVRFILKGESDLLNLFSHTRTNDLFPHVYVYASTLFASIRLGRADIDDMSGWILWRRKMAS